MYFHEQFFSMKNFNIPYPVDLPADEQYQAS